jgi:tetratricopeptide (TPR) repeat protein
MDKQQWALILGSIGLIALLYFGFDTKPPKQKLVEKSRVGGVELQEVQHLLRETMASMPGDKRSFFQGLENIVATAESDSVRISASEALSAAWYDQQHFTLAGYSAERIAGIEGTEDNWSVAGTTYAAALMASGVSENVLLATAGAVRCLENAISLNPENPDHRINLAICYVEQPPADHPMKGIQLLLELNRNYPENTSVLFHLARFGMRTGQFEKAEERLKNALLLDPEQRRLHCLMAELQTRILNPGKAAEHQAKCDQKNN